MKLDKLIEQQAKDHSLQQDFYTSPDVFKADVEKIWSKQWLMADHVSRIPNLGDYFLFKACGEEIIIIRNRDNEINAFFNVCRHRGSRLCLEQSGRKKLITCPYHAWSYDLDGELKSARLMADDFDKSQYGLHRCKLRVLEGVIFINLSEDDADGFDSLYGEFADLLRFQGLDRAKIARQQSYPTNANWKLVVENFLECYHCAPAHPEYSRVHPPAQLLALGAGVGSGPEGSMDEYQAEWEAWKTKTLALGHPLPEVDHGPDSINLAQMMRMPINDKDTFSETKDGKPGCEKLLGDLKGWDGGESIFVFNPLSYILAMNDFAVMIRFTATHETHTDVQFTWLVHEDAVEGEDYNADNIAWLWDTTTKQDKQITENNQAGVESSRYQPGPYSEQENMVKTFMTWYFNRLTQ